MANPIAVADPAFRPRHKKGRPRKEEGKLQVKGNPILHWDHESLELRGITEARQGATVYQMKERLHGPFWKNANLVVAQPPIRSSTWKTCRECPRKFMFKERLGLQVAGYEPALFTGDMFHQLMAAIYKGGSLDDLGRILAHLVREQVETLGELTDTGTGLLPNGRTFTEQAATVEQDAKLAHAMVLAFFEFYPLETLLKTYKIVEVEREYAIKVPGLTVPLVIQVDLLLKNLRTNEYWIVDHKTTSLSPKVRSETMPFEFQPRLYKWVWASYMDAETPEGEPPVKLGGTMHNIVRKPTIRFCAKDADFDAYVQRVREWYQEQALKDPNDPPILQSVVRHTGPVLDEELLVQVHQLNRYSTADLDLCRFYRDDSGCFKFGRKPCPYLPLCRSEHRFQEWPQMIQTSYVQSFRPFNSEEE
ncbi:MAG TPA: PD-(D/E)XK nuclease family protein [Bacillota bacterium]|nr:PD-(D/E)XK nuclease family protein [Bacillota bacterium]